MKKLILAALGCTAVLTITPNLKAQTTIAGWTFENLTAGSTNTNPAPSTNNVIGSNGVSVSTLNMTTYNTPGIGTNSPDIDAGVSGDTGVNGAADLTNTWRVRAKGSGNGWSSLAPIGTQGAEFNVDTTGFDNITVSFDWYTTTQGEANLQLEYTLNGSTWFNTPLTLSGQDTDASVLTNSSNANIVNGSYVNSSAQNWYTDLTASIPAAANDDPTFGIEMVNAATGTSDVSTAGTALNNSSGNWRFDNVVISGEAVPEPGTYGIVALGAALLFAGSKRVRRSFHRA
jgi:hypothetical protein